MYIQLRMSETILIVAKINVMGETASVESVFDIINYLSQAKQMLTFSANANKVT